MPACLCFVVPRPVYVFLAGKKQSDAFFRIEEIHKTGYFTLIRGFFGYNKGGRIEHREADMHALFFAVFNGRAIACQGRYGRILVCKFVAYEKERRNVFRATYPALLPVISNVAVGYFVDVLIHKFFVVKFFCEFKISLVIFRFGHENKIVIVGYFHAFRNVTERA